MTAHHQTGAKAPAIFRIPFEIRLQIYLAIPKHVGTVTVHPPRYDPAWYSPPPRHVHYRSRKKVNFCWIYGFTNTCRQAYIETRHLLYEDTGFITAGFDALNFLITTALPENLSLIQDLHLKWLNKHAIKVLHRCQPHCSEEACWMRELRVFKGLRVLHIMDHVDEYESNLQFLKRNYSMSATHPSTSILRGLVRNGRDIASLQFIRISFFMHEMDFERFFRPNLDLDDIPGWVYSIEKGAFSVQRGKNLFCETLQRIHGPHPLIVTESSE